MTSDFEITGTDDFLKLSKALKSAGRGDLRKELNRALRDAAKPMIPKARASARARLPTRGGLADRVARAPQRVQVRTGRDPGVRIVAGNKGSGARSAEQGTVKHPVFGNKNVWVVQQVPAGWFSEPLLEEAAAVRRELVTALEDLAQRIVREVK